MAMSMLSRESIFIVTEITISVKGSQKLTHLKRAHYQAFYQVLFVCMCACTGTHTWAHTQNLSLKTSE